MLSHRACLYLRTFCCGAGCNRQCRGEAKRRALAARAGDFQVAAHQFGKGLYDSEAESGSAVTPRDLRIGLHKGTEQAPGLGRSEPDAAVGDGECYFHSSACGAARLDVQPDCSRRREFHRVVDQVFQRGAKPHRVADQHIRQIACDFHFRAQAFRLRPRYQRFAERFDQAPRPENFLLQRQRAGVRFRGIDDERGEGCEMLGAVLDSGGPAPFAVAEIGTRQEFAERQDSGKRSADVVSKNGQHGFLGAARRSARPRAAPRRSCGGFLPGF